MSLEYILSRILDELSLNYTIKTLPNIRIDKEFRDKSVEHFLEDVNKLKIDKHVEENIEIFWPTLLESFSQYLYNFRLMDSMYPYLNFYYPKKLRILSEFLSQHYKLNLFVYKLTLLEKRFQKDEIIDIVPTTSSYFSDLMNEDFDTLDFTYKGEILKRLLFNNPVLFKKLKEKIGKRNGNFSNHDVYVYDRSFYIALFDHLIEYTWRISGALMMDLAFYQEIAKRMEKKYNRKIESIQDLLHFLNRLSEKSEYRYKLDLWPFIQNYFTCGIVSLFAIMRGMREDIKFDKKIEWDIWQKIKVKNYPGNLTPRLLKLAKECGFTGSMFIDLETYTKYDFKNPFLDEIRDVFLNEMKEFDWVDIKEWKASSVKQMLHEGKYLSYVGELGGVLHYRVIYGYNGDEEFYVYDPYYGSHSILKPNEKGVLPLRNHISMWGFIIEPIDKDIVTKMKNQAIIIRNRLRK